MNEILRRRRALMGQKETKKNQLVPGTYTKGTSSFTVSETGDITVNTWGSTANNAVSIPFLKTVNISTGDTVRLVITKKSGTVSGGAFGMTVGVYGASNNGFNVITSYTVGSSAWTADTTVTASTDLIAAYLRFQASAGRTFTNFVLTAKIYINGVQIIPEL